MHRLLLIGLALMALSLPAPAVYAAKQTTAATATKSSGAVSAEVLSTLPEPTVVHYESNGLSLKAWVYKPEGPGPFPAIFSNHGSEQDPFRDKAIAQFWVSQGFVFFKPVRSGHGGNPGPYIGDEIGPIVAKVKALRANPKTTAAQLQALYEQVIALHEKANQDVIAAYRWLTSQSYVDTSRIVVMGGSYGGIQTVITAAVNKKDKLGIRGFIPMSPAAESWEFGKPRPQDPGGKDPEANTAFAAYLSSMIRNSGGPLFLMQAHNDYSLGPTTYLGPVVEALGAPNRCAVFPTHGAADDPSQGHAGFFTDPADWSAQVWDFLQAIGEVPKGTAMVPSPLFVSSQPKPGTVPPRRGSGKSIETCGPGE